MEKDLLGELRGLEKDFEEGRGVHGWKNIFRKKGR
jgi:hypothetical protein